MRTNESQDLIFMNSIGSSAESNECNSVSWVRTQNPHQRWTDIIHCPCELHSLMVPLIAWYWRCWLLPTNNSLTVSKETHGLKASGGQSRAVLSSTKCDQAWWKTPICKFSSLSLRQTRVHKRSHIWQRWDILVMIPKGNQVSAETWWQQRGQEGCSGRGGMLGELYKNLVQSAQVLGLLCTFQQNNDTKDKDKARQEISVNVPECKAWGIRGKKQTGCNDCQKP